ncbi:MAG: HD domain-containing protein [Myxococcota bacterium]
MTHDTIFDDLLRLLTDLDGVQQPRRYHPEGDALYHSLQVFQVACEATDDPELLAAALFHDVGKAISGPEHDLIGAQELSDLLSPRVCWLVAHHLDLLRRPRRTRRSLRHDPKRLNDLERLRRWDLAGRDPCAQVLRPWQAVDDLFSRPQTFLFPLDDDDGVRSAG